MPLRFLADENIATSLVKALRRKKQDVKDIKEEKLFGITDKEVVRIAKAEDRIILTHDKDFANLLNFPLQAHEGVVLLRFKNQSPENIIAKFVPLLKTELKDKLSKSLVIIADDFIKIFDRKE